ncbi:MAG: DUF262 domain-containing protein [Candidatus Thorarchaeota archaeon]
MSENPGPVPVEKLIERIEEGVYVIPHFQRDFEWRPRMVCDLIESILQNYFSGLLLFWQLDPEKVGEEWDPIWGTERKPNPREVVLDGQQRISSLYYAFYNPNQVFPETKSYYLFHLNIVNILNNNFEDTVNYTYHRTHKIWDDLEKDKKNWMKKGEIPLAILSAKDLKTNSIKYIDSNEFFNWSVDFIKDKKSKKEIPNEVNPNTIVSIFKKILAYNFVYFTLSNDRDPIDVCNIFTRINQKGMRLTTFDLMNAFLYPKKILLRKDLWENLNNDALKDVDRKMDEYLLKTISLYKQNYCSSKYIYNLIPEKKIKKRSSDGMVEETLVKDGDEFKKFWDKACNFCEKAREKMMNTGLRDFGAIKKDFIPNTTMVPELGTILWLLDELKIDPNDKDFNEKLHQWYWPTVLSEEYSGSSDSVMGKDIRDWSDFLRKDIDFDINNRVKKARENLNLRNTMKGSARYNAILCLLALLGAKDFLRGQAVGSVDFSNQKINDHHIFPSKVKGLEPEKSNLFNAHKNSILNRTLILDETNQKIQNKKPSIYIDEFIKLLGNENTLKKFMESHLISKIAFECMKADDFDNFIKEREKTITEYINKILSR